MRLAADFAANRLRACLAGTDKSLICSGLAFTRVGAGVVVGRERAANAVVAAKHVHDRGDGISANIRAHKDMLSE
jgi:hypothetical protein